MTRSRRIGRKEGVVSNNVQLKRLVRLSYGDAPPDNHGQGDVPIYGSNGIFSYCDSSNTIAPTIIVGRKGSFGKINWSDVPCWATDTTFYIDQKSANVDIRWLYWALQALNLDATSAEAAVPGINREEIYEKPIQNIPLKQQKSIAQYLDARIKSIDALISKKQQLCELLAEKRRALIANAVTRGLDPNVPMRDSGVEWFGKIPAHWQLLPLRRVISSLDQGWSPVASNQPADDDEHGVLKLSAIKKGQFLPQENKALLPSDDIPPGLEIRAGDVFVTRANTPSLVGDAAMAEEDYPNLVFSDLIYRVRVNPALIDARWLVLALISDTGRQQIEAEAKGSSGSMVKLAQDQVLGLLIPVPPVTEQQTIAGEIDRAIRKLHELMDATSSSISLLLERRAALIAEVLVSGKTTP